MQEIHRAEASAILAALKLETDRIHLADPPGVLVKYQIRAFYLDLFVHIHNLDYLGELHPVIRTIYTICSGLRTGYMTKLRIMLSYLDINSFYSSTRYQYEALPFPILWRSKVFTTLQCVPSSDYTYSLSGLSRKETFLSTQ